MDGEALKLSVRGKRLQRSGKTEGIAGGALAGQDSCEAEGQAFALWAGRLAEGSEVRNPVLTRSIRISRGGCKVV